MKESTAVFLGFGVVMLGIIAVPIAFFFYGAHAMEGEPANVGGPISRAFLAVDVDSNGSPEAVSAIDGLLPLGTPKDAALGDLRRDGFDCAPKHTGTLCQRTLHHGSSSESWTVTLTFDAAGHLASRSGSTQAKSL